jgi:Predicted esterase of the alpha-beta hydrolase superfamily
MEMKADAIFEGGGVRGIGFVGAINCMEENGYEFHRLAGTSAGSIMAALLAAGYTGKELSMIMDTDYKKFMDRDFIQSIPLLGIPLGLILEKGLYQGDYIEEWMQGLLKAKGKMKFKDVMTGGSSRLKIIASDITRRRIMILPDCLPDYGIDPMEFEIAKAVRMSCSIPLFFDPVIAEYEDGESYVVDGGVMSNFPVWIFDVDGAPKWPTFGFRLVDSTDEQSVFKKLSLLSYISDIFEAVINEDQSVFMRDKDSVRTVSIPTFGIKSTDFNLSQEDSYKLYRSGYESCKAFLKRWNFQEYTQRYRK